MTLLEKLKEISPDEIYDSGCFKGLPRGCPLNYPFLNAHEPENCPYNCDDCWNREFKGE